MMPPGTSEEYEEEKWVKSGLGLFWSSPIMFVHMCELEMHHGSSMDQHHILVLLKNKKRSKLDL